MAAQPPPQLPMFDNIHPHPATASGGGGGGAPPVPPRFRIDPEPGPQQIEDVNGALLEVAQAIARICATRVLLLLAVVTAAGLWGYTVYDPSQMRLWAAGLYSAATVWPLVFLYWRKG